MSHKCTRGREFQAERLASAKALCCCVLLCLRVARRLVHLDGREEWESFGEEREWQGTRWYGAF